MQSKATMWYQYTHTRMVKMEKKNVESSNWNSHTLVGGIIWYNHKNM